MSTGMLDELHVVHRGNDQKRVVEETRMHLEQLRRRHVSYEEAVDFLRRFGHQAALTNTK